MSTQRLAILAAVSTNNLMKNSTEVDKFDQYQHQYIYNKESQTIRPNGTQYHGNVLLGGAMLSLFVTVICFVCYCCHRNLKKRSESLYRQRWLETDPNMDIYSVEQCYDISSRHGPPPGSLEPSVCQLLSTVPPIMHAPPPSYETVVAMDQRIDGCLKCSKVIGAKHLSTSNQQQTPYPCSNLNLINHNGIKYDNQSNGMETDVINVSGTSNSNNSHNNNILNQENLLFCHSSRECHCNDLHYELFRRCGICGKEICFSNHNTINQNLSLNEQYCRCFTTRYLMNNSKFIDNNNSNTNTDDNGNNFEHEMNANCSRSLPCSSTSYFNNNIINPMRDINDTNNNNNNDDDRANGHDDDGDDDDDDDDDNDDDDDDDDNYNVNYKQNNISNANNNNSTATTDTSSNNNNRNNTDLQIDPINPSSDQTNTVNFETLNTNGLIRMDMSQIIDQTGLPTYEAALKLESSGYV